jgi:hypothetical protein
MNRSCRRCTACHRRGGWQAAPTLSTAGHTDVVDRTCTACHIDVADGSGRESVELARDSERARSCIASTDGRARWTDTCTDRARETHGCENGGARTDGRAQFCRYTCRLVIAPTELRRIGALGRARGTLELAQQLEACPATADALADGTLSPLQAKEIAGAATLNPTKENELIDTARHQPVKTLRTECRRAKASSAASDPMATYKRIHKGRYLRHWTDEEGAFCLKARLTADRGAKVAAVLDHEASIIFDEARKAGSREPLAAYMADALVSIATGGGTAQSPQTVVHVRVDDDALRRGHVEEGEISEIASTGAPVPIPVVSDLMTDAGIKVIFHHAEEITRIYHFTRTINAILRTALEDRDTHCVAPGCGATRFLQIDHTEDFGKGGPTCLANTARLCTFHHHLKTVEGYILWKDARQDWHFDPPPPFGEEEAYEEHRRRLGVAQPVARSRYDAESGHGPAGDDKSGPSPPLF